MRVNQKLTQIVAGRTISGTSHHQGVLDITFGDGSVLKVQTPPGGPYISATGGKVKTARREDTALLLDLEGGGGWQIETAQATSSILLLNEAGKTEYTD